MPLLCQQDRIAPGASPPHSRTVCRLRPPTRPRGRSVTGRHLPYYASAHVVPQCYNEAWLASSLRPEAVCVIQRTAMPVLFVKESNLQ